MGATEIVEKIKEEAVSEEQRIISEAKEKAKLKLEEAKAQIEVQKRKFIDAEERKGVEERERMVRAARLNARKLKWQSEEGLIAKVLEESMKQIAEVKKEGFKGNSYSNILTGLIKDAAMSIIAGSGGTNISISRDSELNVILSDEDADASFVTPDMLNKIADEIRAGAWGVDVRLSLSSDRIRSAGGVIVRGKDEKIEVNNTFEQRMARFSTSLREEIVKNMLDRR
ncbi:V-type ATP synthase subunit E [ANME-1 cluster archaeon GoMg1]|nr:V-type ATP synthase subunit E [ANME-1 cluster archaeon GoMg1]